MPGIVRDFLLDAARDHRSAASERSSRGLQIDQEPAVVERGVGAVDADERRERRHVRVLQDRVGERRLALGHRRDTRPSCRRTLMPWITPMSCTGKRPFGITTYRIAVSATRARPRRTASALVIEHPARAALVGARASSKTLSLMRSKRLGWRFGGCARRMRRAEHRHERQRDDRRDHDRHGERDRELAGRAGRPRRP